MTMPAYRPDNILIDPAVADSPVTRSVLEQLSEVPTQWIESAHELLEEAQHRRPSLARAKRTLLLARHRGRFFKPCPAGQTRGDTRNACCNYWIINYASNCHMECSYCYLQSYLNFPYMVIYANVTDLLDELGGALDADPKGRYRIGTGELADSLALDPLTGYSRLLVPFFAARHNAVLEFKTKSDSVDQLLDLDHRGHTVVSWSMNTEFVQRSEEHKTATIDERTAAARACVAAGYRVAFHLDPLVHYPGWEGDYQRLVSRLFEEFGEHIAWMSLGALRASRPLLQTIHRRFPSSRLPLAEWVPCSDGKLRYFKPIRVEMYQRLSEWIRRYGGTTPHYTCMERTDVWRQALGGEHPGDQKVGDRLIQMG